MAGHPTRSAQRELSRLNGKALPAEYEGLSDSAKLRELLGYSLGQAWHVMQWDVNRVPSFQLAIWNQVRADIWRIIFRIGLEDRRSAERSAALAALVRDLPRGMGRRSE